MSAIRSLKIAQHLTKPIPVAGEQNLCQFQTIQITRPIFLILAFYSFTFHLLFFFRFFMNRAFEA